MSEDTDSLLKSALERYIDDNKPDRLMEKQMLAWILRWSDDAVPSGEENNEHSRFGRLIWKGDYLQVNLMSDCRWTGSVEGRLEFTCRVAIQETSTTDSDSNVHKRMLKRLRKDDYIQKLFSDKDVILCQATIEKKPDELEERVYTAEVVAEGVRRAVWSSAESTMDVLDLVIQYFPLLPSKASRLSLTTALADRAQLRLMEDVMCDACEKEGEDELVSDLAITKKQKT